jgi:hypothetical protein
VKSCVERDGCPSWRLQPCPTNRPCVQGQCQSVTSETLDEESLETEAPTPLNEARDQTGSACACTLAQSAYLWRPQWLLLLGLAGLLLRRTTKL